MKPVNVAYVEAACFTLIGFFSPIADKLSGNEPLTTRSICTMLAFGLIGGLNALKATLSQSSQQIRQPQTINVPVEEKK